jgi:hypothetical protein
MFKKMAVASLMLGGITATLLTGCSNVETKVESTTGASASAAVTVPASAVAEEAENALEAEVGSRPVIDCGEDTVELVNGTELRCDLHAEGFEDMLYGTTVNISDVQGAKYHIDVQVDEEPK